MTGEIFLCLKLFLKLFLFDMKCNYGAEEQTADHIITSCPLYTLQMMGHLVWWLSMMTLDRLSTIDLLSTFNKHYNYYALPKL